MTNIKDIIEDAKLENARIRVGIEENKNRIAAAVATANAEMQELKSGLMAELVSKQVLLVTMAGVGNRLIDELEDFINTCEEEGYCADKTRAVIAEWDELLLKLVPDPTLDPMPTPDPEPADE